LEQIQLQWEPVKRRTWTVAELTGQIREILAGEFTGILVAGEVSGVRVPSSGHCYFTLKDRDAQLQCVCYRQQLRYLRCQPKDGLAVLARGSIDVYEARGQYQLIVEALEPAGLGALQLAFEQLKAKLEAEGLFEPARKRKLPEFPRRIGVVTSPAGAVIRDILTVLERRFPGLHVRVYPAQVQGEGSAESVCRAIEYFGEEAWAEVVIVARGGGSLEDLWTFNEESVARAIAASPVPVISAIGHETDFTIADFVADLRAPTPSAAAELVIRPRAQVIDQFVAHERHMGQMARLRLAASARRLHEVGVERAAASLRRAIGRRQQRVDEFDYHLREQIRGTLLARRRTVEALGGRLAALDLRVAMARFRSRLAAARAALEAGIKLRTARDRAALDGVSGKLAALSPLKILERGYAVVHNEAGAIVKSPEDAPPGSAIRVILGKGELAAKVSRSLRPRKSVQ
jgi:exodeoxyribonuclease VII large subunit